MTETQAVLAGAVVGAAAGIAGGLFGAVASIRASQVAARAPLASTLHKIGNTLIDLRVASGPEQRCEALRDFERSWNEFSIQQRILCPSRRIETLSGLLRATARNKVDAPEDLLRLAGQALEKVSRIVGAHSRHLFRFCALREESQIVTSWLAEESQADDNQKLSAKVRSTLRDLV
jgi:hypothetical protein